MPNFIESGKSAFDTKYYLTPAVPKVESLSRLDKDIQLISELAFGELEGKCTPGVPLDLSYVSAFKHIQQQLSKPAHRTYVRAHAGVKVTVSQDSNNPNAFFTDFLAPGNEAGILFGFAIEDNNLVWGAARHVPLGPRLYLEEQDGDVTIISPDQYFAVMALRTAEKLIVNMPSSE